MNDSRNYTQLLNDALEKGRYVKVAYFTPQHEFYSEHVVMRKQKNRLMLSNGKTIAPDWIASLNEVKAPGFEHIDDFTCDC